MLIYPEAIHVDYCCSESMDPPLEPGSYSYYGNITLIFGTDLALYIGQLHMYLIPVVYSTLPCNTDTYFYLDLNCSFYSTC